MGQKSPEDWNIFRLGEIADIEMGQSPSSTSYTELPEGLPFLQGNADFGVRTPTPKIYCTQPTKICKKDDILISVRAPVGDLNIADQEYCIGRGLAAIRGKPAKVWQPFLFYKLSSERRQLYRLMQGTTFEAVNNRDIKSTLLMVPKSIEEQKKITVILRCTDNAIDKTKEVIEKHKKMKQGLMHDLFIRGITIEGKLRPSPEDAPAFYKDSPLGKIPKEWRLVTLNEIIAIEHGYAFRGEYFTNQPTEYVLLTPGNFHVGGGLYFTSENTKYYSGEFPSEYILNNGDLLIVMTDLTKEMNILGNTVILQEKRKVLHNQRIGKVLVKDPRTFFNYYLLFLMNHYFCKNTIRRTATGTTVRHTSPTRIKASIVPICDYDEQKRIARVLSEVDKSIYSEDEYLIKLIRMKAGLMQDLLTGKVRVAA